MGEAPAGEVALQRLMCVEQLLDPSSGPAPLYLYILLLLHSDGRCFPGLPLCSARRVTQLGCSICCKSLLLSSYLIFVRNPLGEKNVNFGHWGGKLEPFTLQRGVFESRCLEKQSSGHGAVEVCHLLFWAGL